MNILLSLFAPSEMLTLLEEVLPFLEILARRYNKC